MCSVVEIDLTEKLEMQMCFYNIVNNPSMNCIFKYTGLFLNL